MYIGITLPLADARPFLDQAPVVLPRPGWPTAEANVEFIRRTGQVRARLRGAPDGWAGERIFCTTTRAIRFPNSLGSIALGEGGRLRGFESAYRRYYTDAQASARVELGLVRSTPRGPLLAAAGDWQAMLRGVLGLPLTVHGPTGPARATIRDAGRPFAAHLLASTTPDAVRAERWWLEPGFPLLLVELAPGEARAIPPHARRVASASHDGVELHHVLLPDARLWILQTTDEADPERVRNLRLHLVRLHVERQAVAALLRHIRQGRLALSTDRTPLEAYIAAALGRHERVRAEGENQEDLLQTAYGFDELVNPVDLQSTLAAFNQGRNAARLVQRAAVARQAGAEAVFPI